jgi:hypothetical protein
MLIPGYGACKVQCDQVIPTNAQVMKGGVSSLNLDFDCDDGSTFGLTQFMELIGSSLMSLSLKVPFSVPTWMPGTLRSCPNLKKLTIRGAAVDTNEFLRVYRESLMSLDELSCRFNDIVPIYEELTDSQSRLTKTTKRIGCNFDNTQ